MSVTVASDRKTHWVKRNHQCRVPKRWVAFDTESRASRSGDEEIQRWDIGTAIRWRTDLKTSDYAEPGTFDNPRELWQWVTDYCKPGVRTVVIAHNLGHDVRIADVLNVLPTLGWQLEWCNLDRNVSAMSWRSDKGTLVFADLWTWLPVPLHSIGTSMGLDKLTMPQPSEPVWKWQRYCMRDTEIVYHAVSDLIDYITNEDLGNWQPTGAGMAYATWRHKFMPYNVLVHDDVDALNAERVAMHTGRAEAWRHGRLPHGVWTEVDMSNAYVTIAAECDLPAKLKMHTGVISNAQYSKLCSTYRVLCRVRIRTDVPTVPYNTGTKTLWPVGTFTTWLWDTEFDLALEYGATATILETYCYTRKPILQSWAKWILGILQTDSDTVSPTVKTWAKHCGRALIGRLSLRSPRWEVHGSNPTGHVGITYEYDSETGREHRLMSVGNRTLIETDRAEGRDSLPQVTGWIMSECRVRLWRALDAAGASNVAHVDTDSLLVSAVGLRRLQVALRTTLPGRWHVKGSWSRLVVHGPRNYRLDDIRKVSGVPRKAVEVLPNVFQGERWHGLATDIENGRCGMVTVSQETWTMHAKDSRRQDATGVFGQTVPYEVYDSGTLAESSDSRSGVGA